MAEKSLIPIERIASQIYLIRGQKVMLDEDLASLYGVETRTLNQAVTRNPERFPEDFMFRLAAEEFEILKSQIVTSSWGGRRYAPRAFTEQGVAMLSSVLRSKQAAQVSLAIMRTFVRLRQGPRRTPRTGSIASSWTRRSKASESPQFGAMGSHAGRPTGGRLQGPWQPCLARRRRGLSRPRHCWHLRSLRSLRWRFPEGPSNR